MASFSKRWTSGLDVLSEKVLVCSMRTWQLCEKSSYLYTAWILLAASLTILGKSKRVRRSAIVSTLWRALFSKMHLPPRHRLPLLTSPLVGPLIGEGSGSAFRSLSLAPAIPLHPAYHIVRCQSLAIEDSIAYRDFGWEGWWCVATWLRVLVTEDR